MNPWDDSNLTVVLDGGFLPRISAVLLFIPFMANSPAFQFYPGDWLSDPNVAQLTAEEEGAYIRLLAFMWLNKDCQLPLNEEILARMGKVVTAVIVRLLPLFKIEDKFITHNRLLKERLKQKKYSKQQSEKGKKGMESRYGKQKMAPNRGYNSVRPPVITQLLPEPNSSSSSSSIISTNVDSASHGNEDINRLLNFIKGELSLSDFKESSSQKRIWGANLTKLFSGGAAIIDKPEFVRRFKLLASDDFHRKNMGSLQFIYKNIKGFIDTSPSSGIIQPLN